MMTILLNYFCKMPEKMNMGGVADINEDSQGNILN